MAKVKFGDVVKEVKNKIDRNNNPYEFYVAGDHMDTDSLSIPRRGSFLTDDVGPAFIREFKKGQVLYGSRRTYLRKVAVADFDGVTANTTFVLETKDENILRQRLLPFIMYTEGFTVWSIKKSRGSTNPYVLFKDLTDYEFDLPSIEEQDRLAEVLWSINNTLQAYQNLLTETDALVQAQFIEMFGDPIRNTKHWKMLPICDCLMRIDSGKSPNCENHPRCDNSPAVLKLSAITSGTYDPKENKALPDAAMFNPSIEVHNGDLLFSRKNTYEYVGISAYVKQTPPNLMLPDLIFRLVPRDICNPIYLNHLINHKRYRSAIVALASGTAGSMPNISKQRLLALEIPVPPIKLQNQFSVISEQANKSKATLKNSITSLQATKRCILENALRTGRKE